MLRLKCPEQELLLEFLTIPKELPLYKQLGIKTHLFRCQTCTERLQNLKSTWNEYFTPQPDITSSLMRVYSRLQKDETLILKGWKLGESSNRKSNEGFLLRGGWLFRGAVSIGLAGVILTVIMTQNKTKNELATNTNHGPLAQIRLENKNGVKVHYLQPELLQTIEFETTRSE